MKMKRKPRRCTVLHDGPDAVDVRVGTKLRQARRLAGLSQSDLAAGIQVPFQAVQKYEQGESRLSASRPFHAADFLGCPISSFFDHTGIKARKKNGDAFTTRELELIRALRGIEREGVRDALVGLITNISISGPKEKARSKSN